MAKISILGRDYNVYVSDLNDPNMESYDGVCHRYSHEITVRHPNYLLRFDDSAEIKVKGWVRFCDMRLSMRFAENPGLIMTKMKTLLTG